MPRASQKTTVLPKGKTKSKGKDKIKTKTGKGSKCKSVNFQGKGERWEDCREELLRLRPARPFCKGLLASCENFFIKSWFRISTFRIDASDQCITAASCSLSCSFSATTSAAEFAAASSAVHFLSRCCHVSEQNSLFYAQGDHGHFLFDLRDDTSPSTRGSRG